MVLLGLKRHFPGPGRWRRWWGWGVLQLLSALAPGLIIFGGKRELGFIGAHTFKVPY